MWGLAEGVRCAGEMQTGRRLEGSLHADRRCSGAGFCGRAGGHEPVETGSRAGGSSVRGALQDSSISMGKGVQVGHGAHQTAACVCLVSSMEET